MRRFGQLLMVLGTGVGVLVTIAMLVHLGVAGAPWLVNVALAKLGLVAARGLMAGGAVSVRLARRIQRKQLAPPPAP